MPEMTDKERFVSIFREKIKREGSEDLLNFLLSESSDFFTAPASTRYHGAEAGFAATALMFTTAFAISLRVRA